jgi:hypothetical protein
MLSFKLGRINSLRIKDQCKFTDMILRMQKAAVSKVTENFKISYFKI